MIKIVSTREFIIARSTSFFWWKRIYVGVRFFTLSDAQREAVLAHEEGHCNLHHSELRSLAVLLCPFLIKWVCHKTEYAADLYAAERGLAKPLIQVLNNDKRETVLHPSNRNRRKALEQYEYLRLTPVKC